MHSGKNVRENTCILNGEKKLSVKTREKKNENILLIYEKINKINVEHKIN